jgi:hypothetical protein
LQGVFREFQVAEDANQRRQHPCPMLAEDLLDRVH